MKSIKYTYFLIIPFSAIVLTLIWYFFMPTKGDGFSMASVMIMGILNTSVIWLGCMAIVGFLWEKYPWEQKAFIHLIIEIPAIIAYTIVVSYLLYLFFKFTNFIPKDNKVEGEEIFISLLITILITTLHEAYFFYKQWKFNFSKSVKLEKDNINAKYEALKAQINPHFLFNSLNSLVALVEENKTATQYIMDLSDFLRYMLKSREREVVLLREELEVLVKYVNLQKTRFGENLKVIINVEEKYFHYALPPLVLQMLLENCIKHNIISMAKPLVVNVFVKNANIIVENNLQEREGAVSTGNGIRNIQERYAYLTTKKIEINRTNGKFTVCVPIVLVDL